MLPSKGRRNIVIDGVTWHYVVKGYFWVIANNPETGEIIEWGHDVKPKWQTQITPKLIEDVIRTKGNPISWKPVERPKKYITTTLPYANSVPHIGHAFEFILGDALARYFRSKLGDTNVHFNIGLDEHGKKIHDTAVAAGKTEKEYLEGLNIEWRNFCSSFDIQYNSFYRTSHSRHYEKVAQFWEDCKKKGLIYKKSYTGSYCVGCESFKLEKDLVDGKCPDHHTTEIQFVEEENYFFALTKFRKELLEWFESDCNIQPVSKRDEVFNFIDEIQDISISRKKESVPWGIPVPGDYSQVIYVWFEALLNYILIIGYYGNREDFEKYWSESVQVFGPDNLKFQAVIFQGLLSAAGVKHTKTLLCHGTILDSNGRKMSKTVGNVIDPIGQLHKYGIDAVRYYALAGISTYGNSGWDEVKVVDLYNSHLADNYGNLIARTVHLINLNCEKDDDFFRDSDRLIEKHIFEDKLNEVGEYWDSYKVSNALESLFHVLKSANQYFTERQPWAKDAVDVEKTLATVFWVLDKATNYYFPVIPKKALQAHNSLWGFRKEIIFPKLSLVENV